MAAATAAAAAVFRFIYNFPKPAGYIRCTGSHSDGGIKFRTLTIYNCRKCYCYNISVIERRETVYEQDSDRPPALQNCFDALYLANADIIASASSSSVCGSATW